MSGTYEQAKKCFDWYFDKVMNFSYIVSSIVVSSSQI